MTSPALASFITADGDGPQRLRGYDYLLRYYEDGRWIQAG